MIGPCQRWVEGDVLFHDRCAETHSGNCGEAPLRVVRPADGYVKLVAHRLHCEQIAGAGFCRIGRDAMKNRDRGCSLKGMECPADLVQGAKTC